VIELRQTLVSEGRGRGTMKVLLYIMLCLISCSVTQAAYRLESDCGFSDCAHSGWETSLWGSSYSSQTSCKGGDCYLNGWITEDSAGSKVDVTCRTGGCWTSGWDSWLVHGAQTTYVSVTCNQGDCLAGGWLRRFRCSSCVQRIGLRSSRLDFFR
jgi:hypothetical protein